MSASPLPAFAPAPLPAERVGLLEALTHDLDTAGLWWVSGYAAGLARSQPLPDARPLPLPAAEASPAQRITVVYGSQTGNARRVAETLAQRLEAAHLPVRLLRADAYPVRELVDERHLAIVVSTQGDGDPPDDALGFVEFLAGKRAPRLPQLHYAVFGLGDSSYPQFCAIGIQLDARLAELGAHRWMARADADLDIDPVAGPWLDTALDAAKEALKPQPPLATVTPLRPQAAPASPAHTRERPFAAGVLANQRITLAHAGGGKDVRHIELSLEGAGLRYEPGDALGLWPRNPPALVAQVLDILRLDGDTVVDHGGDSLPLRAWMLEKRELTRLARPFIAEHAARARDDALERLLAPDNAAALAALMARTQVVDLLQRCDGGWSAQDLVASLRPLVPRLYSIASSRKAVGDEAHLTVAHVAYAQDGRMRWGAASHLLAGAGDDATLPVYIESNERFRLPAAGARDVIMIGPGTGVAPFRGFVQERTAVGASGRHWLFFGNPRFRSDFLYQLEWQRALKDGRLDRIDLAFSRDQADKIYVQHRIRERGRDLYGWLQDGAHLYVCGAIAMGKDVHAALLDAVSAHSGGDRDAAEDFLRELQAQGRYAKDVY